MHLDGKPGCLVRTPTPIDRTSTAVGIVTRMDEYTKIMLDYAESARAATNSARAYVKSTATYAESVRRAAERTRAATLRAQEQPPRVREHLAECVSSYQICEDRPSQDHEDVRRRGDLMMELNFYFWTSSALPLCDLYDRCVWTEFLCYNDGVELLLLNY